MKMHYRKVTFEENPFTGIKVTSMKVPCGNWEAKITRDSTKDKSKVTCKRCLKYLEANGMDERERISTSETTTKHL